VLELKEKLGPINWQFATTKKFDREDFAGFLKILPREIGGARLRHAVEVRHDSFRDPAFVAMAREHEVAIVIAADSDYPQIADITAPFVYARIMGTQAGEPAGYTAKALDEWAARAKAWAAGRPASGMETIADAPNPAARDVFLYLISGEKPLNPLAAVALLQRLA